MNLKRAVIGSCLAASAMAAPAAPAAFARVDMAVQIGVPPPAPVVEYVPASRYGYVWAPGYWAWHRNHHVWVRGHWVVARPGYDWVQDRWVHSGPYWRHERGHWARHNHGPRHVRYQNNDRYAYRY